MGKGGTLCMGQKHCRYKFIHERRVIAELQIRHHERNSLRLLQEVPGKRKKPCSEKRPISDKDELVNIDFRKETDENGFLEVEVTSQILQR